MIKTIGLITRRNGMSQQEFAHYWSHDHARLANGLPGLVRYVQSHIVEDLTAGPATSGLRRIDGIAELYYADRDALRHAAQSKQGQAMTADDRLFIGELERYLVEERVIIG